MSAEADPKRVSPFVHPDEAERFWAAKYPAYYWWVVLHELLGHGTSKMMTQISENDFNFDVRNPPLDPLSGQPITSWYKPGETWTGQFGDLATTVDECRAELVGAYLMDDAELLALLGFTDKSDITAKDSELFRLFCICIFPDIKQLRITFICNLALMDYGDWPTSMPKAE
jgi:dipeptidyl-peptidase-3